MNGLEAMQAFEAMEVITGMKEGDELEALQALIDTGQAWMLEGSVGRAAMAAIEAGDCILGPVGHRDYYGSYIPSRFEVEPGTKGSVEYAEKQQEERY
jgi:hypothetical protein